MERTVDIVCVFLMPEICDKEKRPRLNMCSGSVTWQGATTTCMHEGLQETGCGYQHHQLSGVTKSLDETPTEIQEAEAITSLHVRASAHAFPGMAPII